MTNIIKLEGFGVYVTLVDGKVYVSNITTKGGPILDADGCIEWDELKNPDNQEMLNEINKAFNLKLKLSDFGKYMSISECLWYVKNLKEMHK